MSEVAYTPLKNEPVTIYTVQETADDERYIKRRIIFFIIAYISVISTETPYDIISIVMLD